MKKLLVILSVVLISASLTAQSGGDYVKTNDGTFFLKKIKVNKDESISGIKSNGERTKFDKDEVVAYVVKGDYFQKMPIYENNVFTGEKDFMKLLETKKGMVLLEYKPQSKAKKYFVFKDQQLVVEMDEKNKQSLTAYFDLY